MISDATDLEHVVCETGPGKLYLFAIEKVRGEEGYKGKSQAMRGDSPGGSRPWTRHGYFAYLENLLPMGTIAYCLSLTLAIPATHIKRYRRYRQQKITVATLFPAWTISCFPSSPSSVSKLGRRKRRLDMLDPELTEFLKLLEWADTADRYDDCCVRTFKRSVVVGCRREIPNYRCVYVV